MPIAITQTHYKLGLKIVDGAATVYAETHDFSMGLGLPDMPAVEDEAFFNIGGVQHKAKITQRFYTYFFAGDAITTQLTVEAKKVP